MNHWDRRFIDLASHVASWSKDHNTKVGAVIVNDDKDILVVGYNDFPRGFCDDEDNTLGRRGRPQKYAWTEHAERNAIYNAARIGTSLVGGTLYVQGVPCINCARAIVQSGIRKVKIGNCLNFDASKWGEEQEQAKKLFAECGVQLTFLEAANEL